MRKQEIIDALNIIYIVWVLITLFVIGLRVPFSIIIEPNLNSLGELLGSLYHLVLLVVIGTIIPKSEKTELSIARLIFNLIIALLTISAGIVALQRNDIIMGVIGLITGISRLILLIIEYAEKKVRW